MRLKICYTNNVKRKRKEEKQMENMTLEQELKARIFLHKTSIVGGILMKEYIQKESQSDIKIPAVTLEQMADAYSEEVMQKAMADGTFEDLYNKAWDKIKYIMPDNMKVI